MCENLTSNITCSPPQNTQSYQMLVRFLIEGIGIPIFGGIGVVGQLQLDKGLEPTI